MLTKDLVTVVISTVDSDVGIATAITSVAEVIDLVSIAAVHGVTPGLDSRAATQECVVTALDLYLADEVVATVQGNAECLPVGAQCLAVDVDLAITQSHAALGTVLHVDSSGTVGVATGTQCSAESVDLEGVVHQPSVTP